MKEFSLYISENAHLFPKKIGDRDLSSSIFSEYENSQQQSICSLTDIEFKSKIPLLKANLPGMNSLYSPAGWPAGEACKSGHVFP